MPHKEPKPRRPAAKRRRRGPTRPNVYVTVIGAPAAAPVEAATPVPAEPDEARELDEPLVSPEWLERRSKRLDAFEEELRKRALDLDVREAEHGLADVVKEHDRSLHTWNSRRPQQIAHVAGSQRGLPSTCFQFSSSTSLSVMPFERRALHCGTAEAVLLLACLEG